MIKQELLSRITVNPQVMLGKPTIFLVPTRRRGNRFSTRQRRADRNGTLARFPLRRVGTRKRLLRLCAYSMPLN